MQLCQSIVLNQGSNIHHSPPHRNKLSSFCPFCRNSVKSEAKKVYAALHDLEGYVQLHEQCLPLGTDFLSKVVMRCQYVIKAKRNIPQLKKDKKKVLLSVRIYHAWADFVLAEKNIITNLQSIKGQDRLYCQADLWSQVPGLDMPVLAPLRVSRVQIAIMRLQGKPKQQSLWVWLQSFQLQKLQGDLNIRYKDKKWQLDIKLKKLSKADSLLPAHYFDQLDFVIEMLWIGVSLNSDQHPRTHKEEISYLSDQSDKSNGSVSSFGSNISSSSTVQNKVLIQLQKKTLHQYIKSPGGSKSFQKHITSNPKAIQRYLLALQPHLPQLMIDQFANYSIGRITQLCSQEERVLLLKSVLDRFGQLACHKKASLPLQRLIQYSEGQQIASIIIGYLQANKKLKQLISSQSGVHIIIKLLKIQKFQKYALQKSLSSLRKLSDSQTGSLFVKTLIQRTSNSQEAKTKIIDTLLADPGALIQGCFSNNVGQQLIVSLAPASLLNFIQQKIINLSNQKFSSFVVQKCLNHSNPSIKKRFRTALLKPLSVSQLIKNQYGSKILTNMLNTDDRQQFKEVIAKSLGALVLSAKSKQKWQQLLK